MKRLILKGIDEEIFYDKCDNGLPIYLLVNKRVNNFYITFNAKYGSIDTEFKLKEKDNFIKVNDGIAHFLEHVNFNEGENLTAHEYFNKLGSSINAFTTFNYTSYQVFAHDNFKKNLEHLLDYVQTPYFTKALVEKEKGIIIEEVKMGKNNPGHKLYYGTNKAVFKKDKRKNYVTGNVSDVKKITKEELQLVYKTFYHPKNMFVVITGNFDFEEAIKIIKENQNKKTFKKYHNPILKETKEPLKVKEDYKEIEANVEIPKLKIVYKMPLSIFKDIDKNLLMIYLSIIMRNNFGVTSNLRDKLFAEELVTGLSANREVFKDVVTLELNVETKNPKKVISILKKQMNHLELTKEQIERRKKANIASIINDYDDIEYTNEDICDQLINNGYISDNLYELYINLDIEEAKSIINTLDLTNNSTVVLIPKKKDS